MLTPPLPARTMAQFPPTDLIRITQHTRTEWEVSASNKLSARITEPPDAELSTCMHWADNATQSQAQGRVWDACCEPGETAPYRRQQRKNNNGRRSWAVQKYRVVLLRHRIYSTATGLQQAYTHARTNTHTHTQTHTRTHGLTAVSPAARRCRRLCRRAVSVISGRVHRSNIVLRSMDR